MKSWLQDNDKEMYSTCNKRKSVVAERFIRTLKNKNLQIYDLVSKLLILVLSIDKLDDIVKNTTIHITAQSR